MAPELPTPATFSITFLGHQGWMFRSGRACVLVDPLLREEFGHQHALEYRVYPPRRLRPEAFPRVDAVLLTHEHDDHFDIPSLMLLDRRIPIYLSARSSVAGVGILTEMGFTVRPLEPGVPLLIADLEILPLCGDHVATSLGDEWDTLPFLIRQTGGAGSFFSMVDATMTPGHIEAARAFTPQPGVVGWTNNTLDWSHVTVYRPDRGDATEPFAERMLLNRVQIGKIWGTPRAMLICAGGFSFYGSRAWLNQRVFCVDNERACEMAATVHPDGGFHASRPGQTFHMEGNQLRRVDKQTPFLSIQPGWPSRQKVALKELPDYAPATGRRDLEPAELARLEARLQELAGAMLGGGVFKGLYSLLPKDTEGRAPTIAFSLRGGAARPAHVFEYRPSACAFAPAPPERAAEPQAAYVAGLECWATDLLAVLDGDLGPIAIAYGRCRIWNAAPKRLDFNIIYELVRLSHPLRRPAELLRVYERLWRACGEVRPAILPPEAPAP